MRKSIRFTALAAAALAFSTCTFAATKTGTLTVTAYMFQSCTVDGGTLVFGNYDVLQNAAVPLNAQSTVSVSCTAGAPVVVTLDHGANPSLGTGTGAGARALKAGTGVGATYLSYSLYSDSFGGTIWGDTGGTSGFGNTIVGAGVPTLGNGGTAVLLPVYGSIAMGQTGATGPDVAAFTDTVVVTAIF
jgi:spore coat protein U-like protein